MMCVVCGISLSHVYREYSKGNIRLSRCDHCHSVADKYVEFELVLVAIDMILHRVSVYRHLLYNRLEYVESGVPRPIVYMAVAMLVVDMWSKAATSVGVTEAWVVTAAAVAQARAAAAAAAAADGGEAEVLPVTADDSATGVCESRPASATLEALLPVLVKLGTDGTLLRFAVAAILEWAAFLGGILLAVRLTMPAHVRLLKYNYLVISVVVSSVSKLLLPMSMIWSYDDMFYRLMGLFVLTSNTVAVSAFLCCTPARAGMVVAAGYGVSFVVKLLCLGAGVTDSLAWA